MFAIVLTEVVTDHHIVAITCVSDCDVNAWFRSMVLLGVLVSVPTVGALIMSRWRDMIFVAAVSAVAGYLAYALTFLLVGVFQVLDTKALLVLWAVCLLAAFAVYAVKRIVLWLAGYRTAPT